jgi:hypothetical protein
MTEGTNVPEDLKYSKDHEWVKVDGDLVVVGITDYAQHALHEITFVELPEVGSNVEADSECGLVESMKASSDIFSPLSGALTYSHLSLERLWRSTPILKMLLSLSTRSHMERVGCSRSNHQISMAR